MGVFQFVVAGRFPSKETRGSVKEERQNEMHFISREGAKL
jgi:hypothetical protein